MKEDLASSFLFPYDQRHLLPEDTVIVGTFRARSTTEIIDAAFQLFKANAAVLVTLAAIGFVPFALAQFVVGGRGDPGMVRGMLGVIFVVIGIYTYCSAKGAIIHAISEAYHGHAIAVDASLRHGRQHLWKILWTGIVTWVACFVSMLLFIIPFFFMIAWVFVSPVVVMLEHLDGSPAIRRSRELCRHSKLRVYSYMFVLWITSVVGMGLIMFISALAHSMLLLAALYLLVLMVISPLYSIFQVLHYYDMRIRNEAYDVELMSQVTTTPEPAVA